MTPVKRAAGPDAVSEDFGDVAVVVDNGLIVTDRNSFDLAGTIVRFDPSEGSEFVVSSFAGVPESGFGPALSFGFEQATRFPGDDDTEEVAFLAGFPFFGTTYTTVWVNVDGNVTFGVPDFASDNRDKPRHVLGPPRVSAFLHDWSPNNAFNPTGNGSIHAIAKTGPDRLVITWSGVADFEGGVSSTFQLILYATGAVEVALDTFDTPVLRGVVGIAEGDGEGPIHNVDLSAQPQTLAAGAVLEAFEEFTQINELQVAREFYKSHPDKFDFLVILSDFSRDFLINHLQVSNQTHGIGTPLFGGSPEFPSTVYDRTDAFGSAGELEEVLLLNNIFLYPPNEKDLVDPVVEPYRDGANVLDAPLLAGTPVTLDGQTMSQFRITGTLPPDDGEISRFFPHGGKYSIWLSSAMATTFHEVLHRWGAYVRFVHPTKGSGFESFDLLGIDTQHWSYFLNAEVPASQFPDGPRSSVNLGNRIVDLGPLSSYDGVPVSLDPGERVFVTDESSLVDGCTTLDQYLMGLRFAEDVGPFFYVDEPESIFTGASLDPFFPDDPLDRSVTMRAWFPQSGIVFKGRRVDLTVQNVIDFEKTREKSDNPKGRRFWGPKGKLKVTYFSDTGLVDPAGDATVTLSESARELGDEADLIDSKGNPIDVKTMAFILLVRSGSPSEHGSAINQAESFRRAWTDYGNGPATGGRGRFDTRLDPPVH